MTPKQTSTLAAKRIPGECSHIWLAITRDTDQCKKCGLEQIAFRLGVTTVAPVTRTARTGKKKSEFAHVSQVMVDSLHGSSLDQAD